MLILLPPSEAKQPGGHERPADRPRRPAALVRARKEVAADLRLLLRTPVAADALLLPPSVAQAALAVNRAVSRSPVLPALDRYAGVLYDGLDATSMDACVRAVAERDVLVFSGLFGVVAGGETIPDYRVPAKTALPTLGVAGTFWRSRLGPVLAAIIGDREVLDLRSSDYAAMWSPERGSDIEGRMVTARILSRKPDGTHGIVSYTSKLYKGKLARAVIVATSAGAPSGGDAVVDAWLAAGGVDARPRPSKAGSAWDLYVD